MGATILPRPPDRGPVPDAFRAPRNVWQRRADPWWAPKPAPLGERYGLPVVAGVVERVTRDGVVIIRAACPFCDRWHQHGHPDAPRAEAGSRVADCSGGQYFVRVERADLRAIEGARRPLPRAPGRTERVRPRLRVLPGGVDA